MDYHSLVQGIFPNQGANPGLIFPALSSSFFTTRTTWEVPIGRLSGINDCICLNLFAFLIFFTATIKKGLCPTENLYTCFYCSNYSLFNPHHMEGVHQTLLQVLTETLKTDTIFSSIKMQIRKQGEIGEWQHRQRPAEWDSKQRMLLFLPLSQGNFFIFRTVPWHWRREWQPTPAFLPGKFHGQGSLVCYGPWGCKELAMTERLSTCLTLTNQYNIL